MVGFNIVNIWIMKLLQNLRNRGYMEKFQEFYLLRHTDVHGKSGTGIVARGVVFPSGKSVLEWCTFHSSVCIYPNINDVLEIHGHEGKTEVVMGTPPKKIKLKIKK